MAGHGPHCETCTCGCTCGYGGFHEPENPRCALNQKGEDMAERCDQCGLELRYCPHGEAYSPLVDKITGGVHTTRESLRQAALDEIEVDIKSTPPMICGFALGRGEFCHKPYPHQH